MISIFNMLKQAVVSFIANDGLSRGAAIAFYTVTSIAPVLLIVVAVAGLAMGHEAAQGALINQLSGVVGAEAAQFLQSLIANAATPSSGILASVIGGVTLIATASGVFGELQTALNKIWRAKPRSGTVSRLIRARATSIGLVAAMGFFLLASLAASAAVTAFTAQLNEVLPFGGALASFLNFAISLILISALFAAIYKALPDVDIAWRDVAIGSLITGLLFNLGKALIGWYIGSSAVASTYGAAGGLIVLMLWIYYSAQILLFGAQLTYVTSGRNGGPGNDGSTAGAA